MRRVVHSGLVPCAPAELAAAFLDEHVAPGIWPLLGRRTVLRAGSGWFEAATPELGGDPGLPAVRFRRLAPTEVIAVSAGPEAAVVHHRFLEATGGCLWVIESRARRLPGEPWTGFARRRMATRRALEHLVDSAAGYYAALT